ncbi:cytochrome c biogenesis protein CcsA, partial [Myxococcota bacterium]|nr:cytochrome c biogenesis protein CcsA [Myxococcota bacterium]
FLSHDYLNIYVAHYSDNSMPWYYLLSAFWGGQDGSVLFWSLMLALATGAAILQNRNQNRELMPTVIAVLMAVQFFFLLLLIVKTNPFKIFMIDPAPINGKGLEPLLQNPAMTFHPPSILGGYVWFTVPFAFAIAALVHKRLDDIWIRTTRRYAVFSWGLLSIGNLFGGMWAYEELGWGGFWGWDPVENASLMPWLSATAYLHSVMIQERRGMLKVWNIFLVLFTYFLTIFGTFLTRSGLIDSVHSFAQSDVAEWFIVFMAALVIISGGLMLWRYFDGSLKSTRDVDSLMSREGVFLLNNFVLIAAVAVVMFGTLGQKISAHFWQETKYAAPWFNAWMVPGGLSLLILMGIGPLIPWRRATMRSFRRNFAIPLVISFAFTALLYFLDAYHLQAHIQRTHIPFDGPLGRLALDAELTGVYALIGLWAVFFVLYTLLWEFVNGARHRASSTGENFIVALTRMTFKNRRRYGGYITHLGFGLLFLSFIGTGLKTTKDMRFDGVGAQHQIDDITLTFKGLSEEKTKEYNEFFAAFDARRGEQILGEIKPSQRNYTGANVKMSRITTEKDEIFNWKANVYLTIAAFVPRTNTVEITAHVNPMMLWMWVGGGVLLIGVMLALWPERKRYRILATARRVASKEGASC